MTVISSITGSTCIHDSTIYLRDVLRDNITDPIGRVPVGGQSGVGFVRTHWPERDTKFPVITVQVELGRSSFMGMQSTNAFQSINATVRVWSQSMRQRDEITDEVITYFNTNRITQAAGSYNLFGFNISSVIDVDEEGKRGVHSKIISVSMTYPQEV